MTEIALGLSKNILWNELVLRFTDLLYFWSLSFLIIFLLLPCINIFVFVDQNIWNIFPTAVAATLFYLLTCSTALILLFIVGQPLDSLTA